MEQDSTFRVTTTPRGALDALPAHTKGLYAISVPQTKPISEVAAGYRWTKRHFPECRILLGDGLYRHTLRAQKGLIARAAADAAKAEGDALIQRFEAAYGQPAERLVRCTSLLETTLFKDALAMVVSSYKANPAFAGSILADARAFTSRQARHGNLAVSQVAATRLAIQYLQEEIAVYLVLARQGWLVDVYLGQELPTLARIIDGRIDGVPDELTHRVNISLRIRKEHSS